MTAREAGREWAEERWLQFPAEHDGDARALFNRTAAVARISARWLNVFSWELIAAAVERWRELQAAERGDKGD